MSIYAIGVLRDKSKIIGIRLIDSVSLSVHDVSSEEVIRGIDNVRNLDVDDGEFVWTHGSVSRYPSIDLDSKSVDNKNSIIVLGVSKDKVYTIANYEGKTTTISEEKLIEYAKAYTLANCKLVTKGDTSYIASISRELDIIGNDIGFKYEGV